MLEKKENKFFFVHVTLTSSKLIRLGNEKKNFSFAFLSTFRNFGFVEVTPVRKSQNAFEWSKANLVTTE